MGAQGRNQEYILACLSAAPSNEKIIREAARLARAFGCCFTALYVQTPHDEEMSPADSRRLLTHTRLAKSLGAKVETVQGEDIAFQIAEFARLTGVTKIVLGRSAAGRHGLIPRQQLTDRLIECAPNMDIYIIPDGVSNGRYQEKKRLLNDFTFSARHVLLLGGVLLAATAVGAAFFALGFSEANIIMVYIVGVLLICTMAQHPLYALIASVLAVIAFNFLFTEPRFTLRATDKDYPVTFLFMFLAALLCGTMATRLKEQARQSARTAYRTKILFDTQQLLTKAHGQEEILEATAQQMKKLLGRDVNVYVREDGQLGLEMGEPVRDLFESSIVRSILGECTLALENERNRKAKEEAAMLAQNEQLRANLLRAISHDLRTPLTSISGNASNLLAASESFDEQTRRRLYTDIRDDAQWLISMVENLLSVTRLENGRMQLNMHAELMDEVVGEAVARIGGRARQHILRIADSGEELLLARMDAGLMVQVVVNLIDNAIKYTPPGSCIDVRMRREGNLLYLSVEDDGPGIQPEIMARIFDMFVTGRKAVSDSRRSLGLGLALCRSIMTAHGGTITAENHMPHGAVFTLTLPAEEVHWDD